MVRPAIMITACLAVCPSASVSARQAQAPEPRPLFTGTWVPAHAAHLDFLYSAGMAMVPAGGQLIIDHRPNRHTITNVIPDKDLDPVLSINGRYYQTIIYRLSEPPRGRNGGFGASGPRPARTEGWIGNELVIANLRPSFRETVTRFSMDGERLKIVTTAEIVNGKQNTVTAFFVRAK